MPLLAVECGVWSRTVPHCPSSLLKAFQEVFGNQERDLIVLLKVPSARPFLMFPRECWLISHQFVNAINVALHVEWDHFQDLRHTNCLVWSLLQSSLLCLNQLNCSTEPRSAQPAELLPTNDMWLWLVRWGLRILGGERKENLVIVSLELWTFGGQNVGWIGF